ncbi:MAG: tyrosine-type recombinase/integrase [Akkermansiaceae bacterium]|nr:tyrosine-type recombinase/integrase [Akkermansiaceae bacterium]
MTIKRSHPNSSMDATTGSKLAAETPKRSYSKSDARYWLTPGRLFKNHGAADYSCRISFNGRRSHVSLNTPNHRDAAKKAAELYSKIVSEGWEVGLADYRPEANPGSSTCATVGELIGAVSRLSSVRPQTLKVYAQAFRCLVAEIHKITSPNKNDFGKGGNEAWRQEVDAVKLDSFTAADIVAWKIERIRTKGEDPLTKKNATTTANSIIRNARGLFGRKILPFLSQSITLPHPLPFEGITLEKSGSTRYISKIDPFAILGRAKEELAVSEPEAFKILVLALVCGLRRGEIDSLLWRALDFGNSVLKIETSEYHQLKSEDSSGVIDLDADTKALFQRYRNENPTALFVINSPVDPGQVGTGKGPRYRCNREFAVLIKWLKQQGVTTQKPIHTLRKEIGSIIASEHGIFAASRYLRHSDIQITAAVYADKKAVVTPKSLGSILGNGRTSPMPQDEIRPISTEKAGESPFKFTISLG